MSWKADVRNRFSEGGSARRWSDMYGEAPRSPEEHFFRRRRDFTVDFVLQNSAPSGTILDLGCGSGPVTTLLRQRGRRVVALDYSLDMLRLAHERLTHDGAAPGDLVQGDSEQLPFPAGCFDAVVCLGVISYAQDYRSVLREIRRVLVPRGVLVLSTRNVFNPRFFDPVQPVKDAVRWLRHGRNGRHRLEIGRFLDPREVDGRLRAEGFAIECFTGMGFGPPRFNRKQVLGTGPAIRLSEALERHFCRWGSPWPYRWLADVNLWICRVTPP